MSTPDSKKSPQSATTSGFALWFGNLEIAAKLRVTFAISFIPAILMAVVATGALIKLSALTNSESQTTAASTFHEALFLIFALLCGALIIGYLATNILASSMSSSLKLVVKRFSELNAACLTGVRECITAMERGDLTASFTPSTPGLVVNTHDELGNLGEMFNAIRSQVLAMTSSVFAFQISLSDLIKNLEGTASDVMRSSQTVTDNAQSLEAATTQISASMTDVSRSCTYLTEGSSQVAAVNVAQAQALSQGMALIDQLTGVVGAVSSNAESAGQAAQQAIIVAQDGGKSVGKTLDGMERIRSSVQSAAATITELGETADQIGTIIETIGSISEQTNLLALNAAIEAARAGEAGRGFSVVADEVRKLAERASYANADIAELIKAIQNRTAQAVTAMAAGTREAEEGSKLAKTAGESLKQIEAVVHGVASKVSTICAATSDMTKATDEVSNTITQVAAVVEETSASATEMSASTREVSASVETVAQTIADQQKSTIQLSSASSTLSDIVIDLEARISQFQTKDVTLVLSDTSKKPFSKAA